MQSRGHRTSRPDGHELRIGTRTSLACTDLDNPKRVNDLSAMRPVAPCSGWSPIALAACFAMGDLVARVGGDELLLILPGLHDSHSAVALMQRLLDEVKTPA